MSASAESFDEMYGAGSPPGELPTFTSGSLNVQKSDADVFSSSCSDSGASR
jgi:hypothetical protein